MKTTGEQSEDQGQAGDKCRFCGTPVEVGAQLCTACAECIYADEDYEYFNDCPQYTAREKPFYIF